MISHPPLISVVMPVYNAAPYLRQAVESVLAQTLSDFEIIAVEDSSTDGSAELLDELAAQDARVKPCHLPKNAGFVTALNEGIRRAEGGYIARMDSNDFISADKFEKQLAFLQANPHIDVVSTGFAWVDPQGQPLYRAHNTYFKSPDIVSWEMYFGMALCHAATMFRADTLRRSGGYRVEYQYTEDYDLFIRINKFSKMVNLPGVMYFYRINMDDSISSTKRAEQIRLAGTLHQQLIFDRLNKRLPLEACALMRRVQFASDSQYSNFVLTTCQTIMDLYRSERDRVSPVDLDFIHAHALKRLHVLLRRLPFHHWVGLARYNARYDCRMSIFTKGFFRAYARIRLDAFLNCIPLYHSLWRKRIRPMIFKSHLQ